MTAFVDTSALYALLDRDDANHSPAAAAFGPLLDDELLMTHNYIAIEAAALVQRRLGTTATARLFDDLLPAIDMTWVGPEVHRAAVAALRAAVRRKPSLVDWTSFEVMRREGLTRAFAFDRDFVAAGFATVP